MGQGVPGPSRTASVEFGKSAAARIVPANPTVESCRPATSNVGGS